MKQGFTLATGVFLLLFATSNAFAQFSVSIGGGTAKYFGKTIGIYPQVNPNTFPFIFGGKLRVGYGFFEQNSINLSFGYYAPSSPLDNYGNYTLTSLRVQNMELELNYHRYLSGRYSFPEAKTYALVGFSAVMSNHNVDGAIELVSSGERKYFENRRIETGHVNIGLGGEVPVRGAFLFLEAKAAIHMNAFLNKTTIWETSLINFGAATAGVRFLVGGGRSRAPRGR
ncbi:hypothetical protein [Rhodoflexus caldus]|uniref:hypothetical protein n=1 Tax=Rhodoflexus caldus TaxID=2891236 RepID=UPI00202AACDE|nr:hypothetical protein [Rhodoflexus caldus]